MSRIGVFLRSIAIKEENEYYGDILKYWTAFNADKKSLDKMLNKRKVKQIKQSGLEEDHNFIKNEWDRLAKASRSINNG